jgi:hypothetical protein
MQNDAAIGRRFGDRLYTPTNGKPTFAIVLDNDFHGGVTETLWLPKVGSNPGTGETVTSWWNLLRIIAALLCRCFL